MLWVHLALEHKQTLAWNPQGFKVLPYICQIKASRAGPKQRTWRVGTFLFCFFPKPLFVLFLFPFNSTSIFFYAVSDLFLLFLSSSALKASDYRWVFFFFPVASRQTAQEEDWICVTSVFRDVSEQDRIRQMVHRGLLLIIYIYVTNTSILQTDWISSFQQRRNHKAEMNGWLEST